MGKVIGTIVALLTFVCLFAAAVVIPTVGGANSLAARRAAAVHEARDGR